MRRGQTVATSASAAVLLSSTTSAAATSTPATRAMRKPSDAVDGEEDEDPAVRGAEADVEAHGERAGDGAAGHDRGDHAQRVGRGERDGALGDERGTHRPGRLAVLALGHGEEPGRTTVARASASGGTMPASMTAAITLSSGASVAVAAAPRPVVAKAYAVLLSGPPMSKAIIRPRMMPRTIAEPPCRLLRPSARCLHQAGERLAEDDDHHEAGDQRRQQRDHQHGHQATHPGRHLPAGDPVRHDAGEDAADDAAEEPGVERAGDGTHHEARGDAGAVGDGVRDVAGQRRDQEPEGRGPEREEQRAEVGEEGTVEQGVVEAELIEVGKVEEGVVDGDRLAVGGDVVAAEQEAQGDEQAAGGHERDHVGDAGHQDPAGRGAEGLLAARGLRRPRWRCPPRAGRWTGRRRSAAPRRSSRRRRRSAASRRS